MDQTVPADPAQRVEVELLPASASTDASLMARLTDLINLVYKAGEEGIWLDDAARTSAPELAELTRAGQIAVARMGDRIVGCVRVQRLNGGTGEFGMLTAAPELRGVGIGRELVRFAERECRAGGLSVMQLELLVPRCWTHPVKEFLREWYIRMGYRVVRTGSIDESYPALAPRLATPCDFVIYLKNLEPLRGLG